MVRGPKKRERLRLQQSTQNVFYLGIVQVTREPMDQALKSAKGNGKNVFFFQQNSAEACLPIKALNPMRVHTMKLF